MKERIRGKDGVVVVVDVGVGGGEDVGVVVEERDFRGYDSLTLASLTP